MILNGHRILSMHHLTLDDCLYMRLIPDSMPCPCCDGEGVHIAFMLHDGVVVLRIGDCGLCKGLGRILSVSLN